MNDEAKSNVVFAPLYKHKKPTKQPKKARNILQNKTKRTRNSS